MSSSLSRTTAVALVATALSLVAVPAATAAPVFGGSTAAGEPIVLTTDPKAKKLRSVVIAWVARCEDGMLFPGAIELTAVSADSGFSPDVRDLTMSRNGEGRFAGVQVAGWDLGAQLAGVELRLSGKLTARRASGTLAANVEISDSATGQATGNCRTGTVRWSATRDPGRVYGGATSQEEPIVLRLDRRRRAVTDVIVGWQAGKCDPPENFFRYGERFVNFQLRSGRFGDAFTDSVNVPDGNIDYGYDLSGTVARRSARGRIRVKVTRTDANGAPMVACDSGNVSWRARTG
jgi:hypothetical protein